MQNIAQDLRYAVRQLRNSPGFTLTAVLTLALGIGATSAIFSAVYGLMLKSLPFPDAGRVLTVMESHPQLTEGVEATYPDFEDWRAQQHSFTEIAAYSTINPTTVSMSTNGRSEQIHRVLASGNFFSVLGVAPILGRTINAADDSAGSNHVAVLSAAAWQRYFGQDTGVIGRTVDLNGGSFTIIGVLPTGAAFPAEGEVWLPLSLLDQATRTSRIWHSVRVLGRLRPGIPPGAARTEMQSIANRLAIAYPATNHGVGVVLAPLRDQLIGTIQPAILSLLGVVVLVLLIACTNVANLLLVRASTNRRDVAVRQALGAGRTRLFSQYLTQSLLLCLLGGTLGTALAACALPLLRLALAHTPSLDASLIQSVHLSMPVLLFTLATCSLTALLFGILPLMVGNSYLKGVALTDALRSGDRGSSGNHNRGRGFLIAIEIAVAVVVLFLSTLVMRSYQKLTVVNPGFRTDHLLSAEITLPEPKYADQSPATNRFYEQLLNELGHAPGVISVASTTQTPLKPSLVMTRFLVEGAPAPTPGAFPMAQLRYISPNFFKTMGLQVQEGRVFEQRDVDQSTNAFVVNTVFAQKYLAGKNPLGATIRIGVLTTNPGRLPILGVVANAHDLGVDADAQPELYLPGFGLHAVLLVRSTIAPESLETTLRRAVHNIDPNQPVYNVLTADALLSDSLARQKMTAVLLGISACIALVLAAIGIYGVLSYSVAQRTREIGVRMAVGANRIHILRLVIAQTGRFTIIGLAGGLAIAFLSARLMGALLFETSTTDPLSISITLGALALIAALAMSIPARRAASVQPSEALRSD